MSRYHKCCIPVTWVYVSTAAYVAAHGVCPDGRALWTFQVGPEVVRWYSPYEEARDKAVCRAARYGIDQVTLCA